MKSGVHACLSRRRSRVRIPSSPPIGQIAQSVEHLSEKQGVGSSILPLATDINNLSENDFIGYFVPYDKSKNIALDTRDVITKDIKKEVFSNEKFYFTFSSTKYGGWGHEVIVFSDVNEFLNQLQN